MSKPNDAFEWAVIGAGPAGIAVVGKLIDSGVKPEAIAWLDPHFTVGDFGSKWRNVPSNTKVDLFLKFLNTCRSFNYANCSENFSLHELDPAATCQLHFMAGPLQWVTEQLKSKIFWQAEFVRHLKLKQRRWELSLEHSTIYAKNVVLAIGAEAKTLSFPAVETIPMDVALDRNKLSKVCTADDTVAVFGASHSAILILRNLLEACSVKKIINFYQSPLRYAVYLEDGILFDDTGLKGTTAEWARENIDGVLPQKLHRVLSSNETAQLNLPNCNKAIYAIGFQKRLISVEGLAKLDYNDKSGIIAPGLFGIGIAFPESKIDRFGILEYRVGLWKFMEYLTNILPIWSRYST